LIYRRNPIKAVLRPLFPQTLRQRISANLRSQYLVEAPPLAPEVRRELLEAYRDDVLKLESLIERDLSGWLK
jgi:hypothetical protein